MTIPGDMPTTPILPPPTSTSAADVIHQQAAIQDYVILRYAVIGLIMIALVSIVGSLFLIRQYKQEVSAGVSAIIALGGAAVGGLSTMLVRPPVYTPPPSVKLGGVVDRRAE